MTNKKHVLDKFVKTVENFNVVAAKMLDLQFLSFSYTRFI